MLEDQMVISCYNEEDAKTLMEIAEHEGFLWASGNKPTQFTYFSLIGKLRQRIANILSDQYVVRYKFSVRAGEKRLWCAIADEPGRYLDFAELQGTQHVGVIDIEDLI